MNTAVMRMKLLLMLAISFYYVTLQLTYILIISPTYAYLGFVNNHPSIGWILISFILVVIPGLWMPIRLTRPSQIVYWFLFVIVYVPSAIIPYYIAETEMINFLFIQLILFLSILLLSLIYQLPVLKVPRILIGKKQYWTLIYTVAAIFMGYIISIFGLKLNIVSLEQVYTIRSAYKEALAASGGGLIAYVIIWQGNVINPLLIISGLFEKKITPFLIGVFAQLLIYSITGFKSILFSTVLIVAFIIVLINRGKYAGYLMVGGITSFVLVSGFFSLISVQALLFIQRLIMMPGLLTGYYIEYFSENDKAYLGYSIFKRFISYQYNLEPSNLIGKVYFGNPATSANANIWADAFANFGFIGILLFTIILAIILWLYDSLSQERDFYITSLLLAVPAFSLSNASLLTCLITHGIALTLLVVYFVPKKGDL
ncbi:hypothetical protein [Brevibacillus sp. SYSU BS000544]|uniref:hypothetical protein n=1 Tax=Brevibacillus sp. SYSU BS000544 TaxID=3416443 RepID=UPI003CE4F90E